MTNPQGHDPFAIRDIAARRSVRRYQTSLTARPPLISMIAVTVALTFVIGSNWRGSDSPSSINGLGASPGLVAESPLTSPAVPSPSTATVPPPTLSPTSAPSSTAPASPPPTASATAAASPPTETPTPVATAPVGLTLAQAVDLARAAAPESAAFPAAVAEAGPSGNLIDPQVGDFEHPAADHWIWYISLASGPPWEGSIVVIDYFDGRVYGVINWVS